MTDSQLILEYLKTHPGYQNAIDMMRDMKPGCIAWAMRSRISDLNRKVLPGTGMWIESRIAKNGMADYRLVSKEVQEYDDQGQALMFGVVA